MTNGDMIRQMTDEELYKFLFAISECCSHDYNCEYCPCYYPVEKFKCNIKEWLKQEKEDK